MQYTRFPPRTRGSLQIVPAMAAPSGLIETDPAPPVAEDAPVRLRLVPMLLMLAILVPVILNVAGLTLTASRIALLVAVVPVFFLWLTGTAGRIRAADILVVLCALWTIVAMVIVEGMTRFPYASIVAIEMLGPYLIARCYIRSAADYAALVRFLRWIAIFLAPAALIEALTYMRPYVMLLDPVFRVFPKAMAYELRLGMSRAQVVFEHPILYGVYVATFCAPVYMLARAQGRLALGALLFVSPVLVATFLSLSTGAYLGLMVQIMLIAWGYATRHLARRWVVLAVLVAIGYIVVDLISNRTPFEVFISYMTFNSETSYARVLIFTFGMDNVWANPWFGLGLRDWVRPHWFQHDSVDNFWLLMAMRYGIPAFVLIGLAFAAVLAAMMRARPASAAAGMYRLGHVFALIGLAIALCTVHLWSATFVFMMFMLGAGLWVADAPHARGGGASGLRTGQARPSQGAATGSRASDQTPRHATRPPAVRA